jgi:hypothetical protein
VVAALGVAEAEALGETEGLIEGDGVISGVGETSVITSVEGALGVLNLPRSQTKYPAKTTKIKITTKMVIFLLICNLLHPLEAGS